MATVEWYGGKGIKYKMCLTQFFFTIRNIIAMSTICVDWIPWATPSFVLCIVGYFVLYGFVLCFVLCLEYEILLVT